MVSTAAAASTAMTELGRAIESAVVTVGSPLLAAASGAAGAAGAAVQAIGGFCGEGRRKSVEFEFLNALRHRGEPYWIELQDLLEQEVEGIWLSLGLDAADKVSAVDFQFLKPRFLERGTVVKDDIQVVFERFDHRPYDRNQDIDMREVKLVFHLVLQARTDVLAAMLHGELERVWRRTGENSIGIVDPAALHTHARSYAARLPSNNIRFSDEDVAALADHYIRVYGRLPLEHREFAALLRELYFELMMMAWLAGSIPCTDLVPSARDRVPGPHCRTSSHSSRHLSDSFHGACLPVVS